MCGIIGIVGNSSVEQRLLEGLKRLEYRGYDSAGIATLNGGEITRSRAEGKLSNLEAALNDTPLFGETGIGHTRWATHGAPTVENAHPHTGQKVAVVHNGIIENFKSLRDELEKSDVIFSSATDTEVIAHLIDRELQSGNTPEEAVKAVLPLLEGAFALAIIFKGSGGLMIGARRGSPLVLGFGDCETYLGSDAIALATLTQKVCYLEDGDWVVITATDTNIYDAQNKAVERPVNISSASKHLVDKGNHRHFMAKEIAEQPEVLSHVLSQHADLTTRQITLPDMSFNFADLTHASFTACGTAYYAALTAKYWFEKLARLPVEVDVASEFRYREAPLAKNGCSVVISQSGETADSLAALRYCIAQDQHTIGVVNVTESTIARESELVLPIYAGPEIGVASTKAFTSQLMTLACLAIAAGRQRGEIDADKEADLVRILSTVPRLMSQALAQEDEIKRISTTLAHSSDILYLGRGLSYPIALEGALKLKEISYIHAEGYAAGELKHGPIALIDEDMPVIVIAPKDDLFDKTISNMQEVSARGGRIILITDEEGAKRAGSEASETILIPTCDPFISPLITSIPVQLLAYHTAVFMGTDVDQPRNLAKSVTVE